MFSLNHLSMHILFIFLFQWYSQALTHHSVSAGLGYYYDNSFNKLTSSENGEKSFLGTTQYPLLLEYDYELFNSSSSGYFLAPKLQYTLMAREEAGDAAKSTFLHFVLPLGMNFGFSNWDWTAGPGILRRTIDGKGGILQLNNGNSTAPFAAPGRKVSSQVVTFNLSTSYNMGPHSAGLDLVTEGITSDKRTFSIMLSYMYQFDFGSGFSSKASSSSPRATSRGR
ncbi:MAG: hypothetical protein IT287_04890 [Bdellovibrionaceae bacterium]|nr:hypothetical protein [Pseudobdellovibrionaceae bacterium]